MFVCVLGSVQLLSLTCWTLNTAARTKKQPIRLWYPRDRRRRCVSKRPYVLLLARLSNRTTYKVNFGVCVLRLICFLICFFIMSHKNRIAVEFSTQWNNIEKNLSQYSNNQLVNICFIRVYHSSLLTFLLRKQKNRNSRERQKSVTRLRKKFHWWWIWRLIVPKQRL